MAEGNNCKTMPICAICWDQISIKSHPNACMHEYCFKCLLHLSVYKPVCPLCKKNFHTIVHNDIATGAYEEHKICDESNAYDSDSDSTTSQSSSSSSD